MIEVRDLSFGYKEGGFHLDIQRFDIAEGEKVAIIGPSGIGKTTLLNLLAGILHPHSGTIRMGEIPLSDLGREDRQDLRAVKMGLVFQEFELLEYLHILDNILLPYRVNPVLELTAEIRQRAKELALEVGLGDLLRRYPRHLSQGERQRTAVCRALVTQPAVVLGDEPTGNLDPTNRDHILDILCGYSEQSGAPLVIVTHDHEILERFDRTVDVRELTGG